jgi:hypothetical protein
VRPSRKPPDNRNPRSCGRRTSALLCNYATSWIIGSSADECFTINRLDVLHSLHRCLATTNVIESPHSGVRIRTRRVCRWRDGGMVKRWMAAAFLATERNFRKMMGYRDLWALEAILNGSKSATRQAVA